MATAAGGALAGVRRAQRPYPGVHYRDYSKCLPVTFVISTLAEKRNRALAALTTGPKI
jgi:hypothetical protein